MFKIAGTVILFESSILPSTALTLTIDAWCSEREREKLGFTGAGILLGFLPTFPLTTDPSMVATVKSTNQV